MPPRPTAGRASRRAGPSAAAAAAATPLHPPSTAAATAAAMDLDAFLAGGFDDVAAAVEGEAGSGGRGGSKPTQRSAAAGNPPPSKPAKKHSRLSAADRHKADLAALKDADPDFYEYLAAADEELLAFEEEGGEASSGSEDGEGGSASSDDDDDDDDSGGEVEDAPAPARLSISPGTSEDEEEGGTDDDEEGRPTTAAAAAAAPATPDRPAKPAPPKPGQAAAILEWCRATKADPSLRALRTLMQTYRAACHHGEVGADEDDGGAGAQAALRLGSGAAFNALLLFVLREADGLFRRVLDLPSAEADDGKKGGGDRPSPSTSRLDPRTSPRWRKAEPLIKSYLGNTVHLLGAMTDPAMSAFILRCARPSVPFLVCSERLQRKWVQAALKVFGGPDPGPALQAALFVRAAALSLPDPAPDAALKGLYREYVASAKFMSASTAARLALAGACVVETYGAVGGEAAYRHAFTYVRQLAQVVRGAMGSKAKDAFRAVYCWQTVACLELWARAVGELAAAPGTAALGALAFPVAHLLQAAACLVPTPRYFPLRLRCLRALVGLASATGVHAPVAPLLCDILDWKNLCAKKRGRGGGRGGSGGVAGHAADPDAILLRASKASLASPAFQADLVDQVVELLADHLAAASTDPAFPELARPTLVRLRAFMKRCPAEKHRTVVSGLVAAIESNAALVLAERGRAGFAPADGDAVRAFLAEQRAAGSTPLARYAAVLAQRARDRRSMQTADVYKVGGDGEREEEEASSDEDGGGFAESSSDEEAERAARARPARKKNAGAAAPSRPATAQPVTWTGPEDEDMLAEYCPSDSD